MAKYVYGVKLLESGDVQGNGEMPSALAELCRTYRDSVTFREEEGTTEEEYSDQRDEPEAVFTGTDGKKVIEFETFDWTPALLKKLKGGTVLSNKWSAPITKEDIY
mgnify:CR=1 FL=1